MDSGTASFEPTRNDSSGFRFLLFKSWLKGRIIDLAPDLIMYEAPWCVGNYAKQVLFTMVGIMQMLAAEFMIDHTSTEPKALKKWATGNGNAKKEDMIKRAHELFPDVKIVDDNHADALLLAAQIQERLREDK